jgi:hypothetical protein
LNNQITSISFIGNELTKKITENLNLSLRWKRLFYHQVGYWKIKII